MLSPALIAGLPGSGRCVIVGPPLFARAASAGLPDRRLFPWSVIVPATFALLGALLPSIIVFFKFTVPDTFRNPPPCPAVAVLLVNVSFNDVTVPPLLYIPPPSVVPVLPEMVELLRTIVPAVVAMAP